MSSESSTKDEQVQDCGIHDCHTCKPWLAMTFSDLRRANARRLPDFVAHYGGNGSMEGWSAAEWTNALAGEVGELCNLTKKIGRGQDIPVKMIADELADTQIYLDLCAQKLQIDLAAATRSKFNERSMDIGSEVRL